MNNVSVKLGGSLIEYEDKDLKVRELYERECARNRVEVTLRRDREDSR